MIARDLWICGRGKTILSPRLQVFRSPETNLLARLSAPIHLSSEIEHIIEGNRPPLVTVRDQVPTASQKRRDEKRPRDDQNSLLRLELSIVNHRLPPRLLSLLISPVGRFVAQSIVGYYLLGAMCTR